MKHWSDLMQTERLYEFLRDALHVPGDVIDFRVYKGNTFANMVNMLSGTRHAYGIDRFSGLDIPTARDRNQNNTIPHVAGKFSNPMNLTSITVAKATNNSEHYTIFNDGKFTKFDYLPTDAQFCFGILDLKHYYPTRSAIEYLWDHISYGGTILVDDYNPTEKNLASGAITEFIKSKGKEVETSRQMLINGVRETTMAIKCYPANRKPDNWESRPLERPISIAMVLKTGGPTYDASYVNNLTRQIKEHVTIPHEVVCLTDNREGIKNVDRIVKLKHDWPKWWGKMELFRKGVFPEENQVFFFDLDTFVIDNIDEILRYSGEFCSLRDFYHLHSMGSGFMSWHGERVRRIYEEFKQDPSRNMNRHLSVGDQGFISFHRPVVNYIQDHFPGQIVSYKRHCLIDNNKEVIPTDAKIICFHGAPRPHELKGQMRSYWNP
jgi:hypothetical protein